MIDPSVSVPRQAAARPSDAATPLPLELPLGSWSRIYAAFAWPPSADQPLDELLERKFAHWLRLALPSRMAPAARSLDATKLSRGGRAPRRAKDPAVVFVLSRVAMLFFKRMGMPWRGLGG